MSSFIAPFCLDECAFSNSTRRRRFSFQPPTVTFKSPNYIEPHIFYLVDCHLVPTNMTSFPKVRSPQPIRDIRRHHDRLLLRGVFLFLPRRPACFRQALPGPPCVRDQEVSFLIIQALAGRIEGQAVFPAVFSNSFRRFCFKEAGRAARFFYC